MKSIVCDIMLPIYTEMCGMQMLNDWAFERLSVFALPRYLNCPLKLLKECPMTSLGMEFVEIETISLIRWHNYDQIHISFDLMTWHENTRK